MRVSDVISNVTKQNKTWTSWLQGTKLRVRLSLPNARFASLLSKVMYIIKRKFKCLSWIWLLFHLVKWKNMYILFVPSALMKYTFFHFTRWNKSHIHSKHLNILYIFFCFLHTKYNLYHENLYYLNLAWYMVVNISKQRFSFFIPHWVVFMLSVCSLSLGFWVGVSNMHCVLTFLVLCAI